MIGYFGFNRVCVEYSYFKNSSFGNICKTMRVHKGGANGGQLPTLNIEFFSS